MFSAAFSYDFFYLMPRSGVPAGTILFVVLFGPISCLLWNKENLRDCNAKSLLKFCIAGVLVALVIGFVFAFHLFIHDSTSGEKAGLKSYLGAFMIFLVVAGIVPVFVGLSLLRLGIKRALEHSFGAGSAKANSEIEKSSPSPLMRDAEDVNRAALKKLMSEVPAANSDEFDKLKKEFKNNK